jgi:hypothetical protein
MELIIDALGVVCIHYIVFLWGWCNELEYQGNL